MVRAQRSPDPTSDLLVVGRSLFLDSKAGAAVQHLRAAGVPSIVLKGKAIATWLYEAGEARPYADVDLLVPPAQFERATELLAEFGYVHRLSGAHPSEVSPKERVLVDPANVCIDLHRGLVGVPGLNQRCWDVLSRRTVALRVGGTDVDVLDTPARALHLALHAAQNGPIDRKAVADLERGLAKVGEKEWREAAELAEELGATDAFAAGLRLLPAGRLLAAELCLPHQMTVELALRTRSAPQDAIFFERLAQAEGVRAKATLLARKLFPTSTYLRANSAMANRGWLGFIGASLYRLISLGGRLGPAFVAWRRARRAQGVGARRRPRGLRGR